MLGDPLCLKVFEIKTIRTKGQMNIVTWLTHSLTSRVIDIVHQKRCRGPAAGIDRKHLHDTIVCIDKINTSRTRQII